MSRDDLPRPKAEPLVTIRLVDPDVAPTAAPIEERMDLERTRELHQEIRRSGQVPGVVQSAAEAFGSLHLPTKDEVQRLIDHQREDCRLCGTCARFDHEAGQEGLRAGGAQAIMDALGASAACLGAWERYGLCTDRERSLVAFDSPPCPNWKQRRVFGRILGGVWRRFTGL